MSRVHSSYAPQKQPSRRALVMRGTLRAAALLVPLAGSASCSSAGEGPAATGGAGNPASGGNVAATGGSSATGGQSPSGGSGGIGIGGTGTGGTSIGGSSSGGASGGAMSTGGGSGTGGAPASGGVSASGGETGTGGASNNPLSPGCGKAFPTPPPKNQQQTVQIQGDPRYYLMEVPAGADNETPLMLVLALHGFDMNNIAVVNLFNFTQRSAGKAITVWPQGEGPHPGDVSHWGDQVLQSTWNANEKNYAFLEHIITDLGDRYCIDRERIFIAGFSMGGFFTNQIACDHSDWFRAFAPVAGGGPQACAQSNVQSAIMVQHGTADPIVDISSGEGSRDFWLEQNGCGQSSTTSLNNCAFYAGCADEKPVAWCTGNYDHYIPNEAASNIWSFFSSF